MKKVNLIVITFLVGILFSAQITSAEKNLVPAISNLKSTQSDTSVNVLQAVFDNYFALKDALVKTDGESASANAPALLAALDAVKEQQLKADEQTVWKKIGEELKTDADHISHDKEVAHQREHFITLSKNMIELIKTAKPTKAVYLQHCPMANGGKGADWLSKDNFVRNPYYGNRMLTCGKVVETIKQ